MEENLEQRVAETAPEAAVERIDQLLTHALKHDVTIRKLPDSQQGFYLFELQCNQCGWWDRWDERTIEEREV